MGPCYERLTSEACTAMLGTAVGLRVSRVWESVEPTVFLELGRLKRRPHHRMACGQVTVMIESDWRVERGHTIWLGSCFKDSLRERRLEQLVGQRIAAITTEGRISELCILLQDNRGLTTYTDWRAHPQWTVLFYDVSLLNLHPVWNGVDVTPCLSTKRGKAEVQYCFDPAEMRKSARQHLKSLYGWTSGPGKSRRG